MRRALACLALLAAVGCGDDETVDPCVDAPTFTNDVQPIAAAKCVTCHSDELSGPARNGAPPHLDFGSYDQIEPDRFAFADAITSGRMPPPGEPGTLPVSREERALVDAWRRCGFPR